MRNKKAQAPAKTTPHWQFALTVGISLLCVSSAAYAADPLGDGICKLVSILTGKWLFGATILATLASGSVVMFGGEISDLIKKVFTIITIVGVILSMASILAMIFSTFTSVC